MGKTTYLVSPLKVQTVTESRPFTCTLLAGNSLAGGKVAGEQMGQNICTYSRG
jgi:hypothetical protein